MSIQSSMQTTEVWELTLDEYGEPKQDAWGAPTNERHKLDDDILCAINYSMASNISKDINYSEITHVGLTACRTLKKGQILKQDGQTYLIDKVPNNKARLTQLYLKEVTA